MTNDDLKISVQRLFCKIVLNCIKKNVEELQENYKNFIQKYIECYIKEKITNPEYPLCDVIFVEGDASKLGDLKYGEYDPKTDTITIYLNKETMQEPLHMVMTIEHEFKHYFQHIERKLAVAEFEGFKEGVRKAAEAKAEELKETLKNGRVRKKDISDIESEFSDLEHEMKKKEMNLMEVIQKLIPSNFQENFFVDLFKVFPELKTNLSKFLNQDSTEFEKNLEEMCQYSEYYCESAEIEARNAGLNYSRQFLNEIRESIPFISKGDEKHRNILEEILSYLNEIHLIYEKNEIESMEKNEEISSLFHKKIEYLATRFVELADDIQIMQKTFYDEEFIKARKELLLLIIDLIKKKVNNPKNQADPYFKRDELSLIAVDMKNHANKLGIKEIDDKVKELDETIGRKKPGDYLYGFTLNNGKTLYSFDGIREKLEGCEDRVEVDRAIARTFDSLLRLNRFKYLETFIVKIRGDMFDYLLSISTDAFKTGANELDSIAYSMLYSEVPNIIKALEDKCKEMELLLNSNKLIFDDIYDFKQAVACLIMELECSNQDFGFMRWGEKEIDINSKTGEVVVRLTNVYNKLCQIEQESAKSILGRNPYMIREDQIDYSDIYECRLPLEEHLDHILKIYGRDEYNRKKQLYEIYNLYVSGSKNNDFRKQRGE